MIFKSNVWAEEWQELYQILDLNLDVEDIYLLCDVDIDPLLEVCWWKEGF